MSTKTITPTWEKKKRNGKWSMVRVDFGDSKPYVERYRNEDGTYYIIIKIES